MRSPSGKNIIKQISVNKIVGPPQHSGQTFFCLGGGARPETMKYSIRM